MNNLVQNLHKIQSELPEDVTLVAVSKTKPISDIIKLYDAGQRVFGENRAEELQEKYQELPKDIKWQMIGHLQSKKVKKIAPFIDLIHSVDSFKLLKEINKEAIKNQRIINCLLQFHIAKEETKYGLGIKEATQLIQNTEFKSLKNISIKGIMGMATNTEDTELVKEEFKNLKSIGKKLRKILPEASIISMGMSNDYKIALQEGSNMLRIGSTIFGGRTKLNTVN